MFEIDEIFSLRVRERRALNRLSVAAAAKEIGISRRTLALVEMGKLNAISRKVYEKITKWMIQKKEVM